jgi:adenine-specific DNA-methyltransferase
MVPPAAERMQVVRHVANRGSDPRSLAGRPRTRAGRLGQVITPHELADRMAADLLKGRPDRPMRVLDPCVGPGTFPSALARNGVPRARDTATALDIDPAMIDAVCRSSSLAAWEPQVADYLWWRPPAQFDAAILNPPYIRQEWVDDKERLRRRFIEEFGAEVPGTANLYVYFLVKALSELAPGGRMIAIIYDGWCQTLYGRWLADWLACHADSLDVERVAAPFDGRLIDATIIKARRGTPTTSRSAPRFEAQDPVGEIAGMAPIGTQLETRRGLRLKQSAFFLCSREDCDRHGATPFLKKVRHVNGFAVDDSHPEAALLVTSGTPDHPALPELRRRLRAARREPDKNESILTWVRERPEDWYVHRPAPVAPLVVNYYLRTRPRHLLNPGLAYSDNFYGLTPPAGEDPRMWFALLNSSATAVSILAHARPQGSGLRKVQLFEYRTSSVPVVAAFDRNDQLRLADLGTQLANGSDPAGTLASIDRLVASTLLEDVMDPANLAEALSTLLA